jgi:hypothetical protein
MYLSISKVGWTEIALATLVIAYLALRMMFRAEALPEDVREAAYRRRAIRTRSEKFWQVAPPLVATADIFSLPPDLLFLFSVWALLGVPLAFLFVRRRILDRWAHQLRTGGDFRAEPDYGLVPRVTLIMFGSVIVVALAVNWLQRAT